MKLHVVRRLAALAFAIAIVVIPLVARAAPGDPDPAFDGDGFAAAAFPGGGDEQAEAILVQSDGRIVVGGTTDPSGPGDFALARLMDNGSPDTSFSGDGFRTVDVRAVGGDDEIWDLAVQRDGKIVAAGFSMNADGSSSAFGITRFRANGSLDRTFSGDGKLIVTFPHLPQAFGYGVAIQKDGKILVGGEADPEGSSDGDMALVRVTKDGALDTTFGGDGRVLVDFNGLSDAIWKLAVQPDGKIVGGGWSKEPDDSGYRFAFVRFKTDGRLDRSFSGDGKQTMTFPGDPSGTVRGLFVRRDGKIVAGGDVTPSSTSVGLVRLKADGTPDGSFDGDGEMIVDIAEHPAVRDFGRSGKKLVAAGFTNTGAVFVARFRPDGSPDTTFGGGDGYIISFPVSGDATLIGASAVQRDGRILAAGQVATAPGDDFLVARFLK